MDANRTLPSLDQLRAELDVRRENSERARELAAALRAELRAAVRRSREHRRAVRAVMERARRALADGAER